MQRPHNRRSAVYPRFTPDLRLEPRPVAAYPSLVPVAKPRRRRRKAARQGPNDQRLRPDEAPTGITESFAGGKFRTTAIGTYHHSRLQGLAYQMDDMNDFGYTGRGETDPHGGQSPAIDDEFVAALTSGGDSRLDVDRRTGANKYLCPPTPVSSLICASSCTASPITARGFRRAADFFDELAAAASPPRQAEALERRHRELVARLLGYFGVADIAEALLCPSGTDALRTAATLVAAERPGGPITAILPQASETGSGVPLAVAGGLFDRLTTSDAPPPDCAVRLVEIPLRSVDGAPRSDDEVVDAYDAAAARAWGRSVVYMTHSTKTGLIAPVVPPPETDVVVDACQARIEPTTVAKYLRKGWPVVVTGSKFFGGPAFSGAVLFPVARLSPAQCRTLTVSPDRHTDFPWSKTGSANVGTVLRWIAALDMIEAFAPLAGEAPDLLRNRAVAIERGLGANAALVPVGGLAPARRGWSDLPSIFTFGVRDPADRRRLLSVTELRPLYERLASDGVLLGQPVGLGRFGGLRIAVGARDLLPDAAMDGGLSHLFAALEDATRA